MNGRWLAPVSRRPHAAFGLVCFPYGGGSAAGFHGWGAWLPASFDAYAVQLPGRANRLREPPRRSLPGLVEELADVLAPALKRPTILFGHSMGALLAFEVARVLRRRGDPEPRALLLSGCRAAHVPARTRWRELDDEDFVAVLATLGGTPAEVLENRELVELALPALRADLELAETYRHEPEPPLEVPIAAFAGTDDELATPEDVRGWCRHTEAGFSLDVFVGGHFFLDDAGTAFRERVVRRLTDATRSVGVPA
jgi:medium-chain acyl-[acyl-carrier-protein] hydrolase